VRAGDGRALILVGDPGIGKSALLDHAARQAGPDTRVLRMAGVEREAEMPYSALHLLLRPVADRIDGLPEPQSAALRGAFGMGSAAGVDPFLVGLATLTLLSESAMETPLLCLVDDGQWVDTASIEAVCFAARRFVHDAVGVVLATRENHAASGSGLPVLRLDGLAPEAATTLLTSHGGGLPARIQNRVLELAAGNPLALLELPKAMGDEDAWDGSPVAITDRLQRAFTGQVGQLDEASRMLLVIAAAEGTGDLGTILEAADRFGVPPAALAAAEQSGIIVVDRDFVRFRHPLIRTAVYSSALFTQRRAAHQALAAVLEGHDAYRGAWHLAAVAAGPDEKVAAVLEHAAEDALRRGGQTAAVCAYERAARLSESDDARGQRLVAAAEAAVEAARYEDAERLCSAAARLTAEPVVLARLALVRGRVEFDRGYPSSAARIAIDGTAGITAVAPEQAAEMLVLAAYYAGHSVDLPLVGEAVARLDALDLPPDHGFQPYDRQVRTYHQIIQGEVIDHAMPAGNPSGTVWEQSWTARAFNVIGDAQAALETASAMVAGTRVSGLMAHQTSALFHQACAQTLLGRHRAATIAAEEALAVAAQTGQDSVAAYLRGLLAWLAALDGNDEQCTSFAAAAIRHAGDHRSPPRGADATWALALLDLGHGRYESALSRLENRWRHWPHSSAWIRCTADHVEAAVRAGERCIADQLVADLGSRSERLLDPCAPAIVARCRALTAPGERAEQHFQRALEPGPCDDRPFEQARTLLLYGQWLRRRHRRADARVRLRAALEAFQTTGAKLWESRAREELRATGDRLDAPTTRHDLLSTLTSQELRVVQLAATGATNRDIGARLLLSPRTVGRHLYRAFPKLGITNRTELATLNLDL